MENPTSIIRIDAGEKFAIESSELISLRDGCFPEMLGTEKEPLNYWLWKHGVDNEGVSSRYLVAVIEPESRLVGFYAARRLSYRTPQGPAEVGLVCDVMTSPSFQGRGIFVRLGTEAVNGFLTSDFDTLTGYPIRRNVLPGHRKVGWSFTDRLPIFIAIGSQNYWRYRSLRAKTTKFTVSACAPIDLLSTIGFASFYEEWKLKAELQEWSYLDLSNEFVKWRYSAPGVNYVATIARDGEGEIVGFAIGRRMKIGRLYFLVIGDVRQTEKAVVPLMLSNLRSQTEKVIGIAGMFSRAASKDLRLKRCGFIPTFKKFWLIQFTRMMLEPSVNSDTTLTNPYLTWSDTDDI
jgi:hypothetical protein